MMEEKNTPMRAPWEYDIAPFKMCDQLYYVGNKSVSSHLFDTGDGLLLLDTTYSQTGYMLIESIREAGFDPHDIRWLLHSHGHYDHFGATRMLVEKYGCKTYLPEVDVPYLKEKAEFNYCAEDGIQYEPPYDLYFDVDVPVKVGDVLTFGGITVDCHSAAGHTPGTMCYVFHLPNGLKAAMHGGIGLNTLTSAYGKKYNLGRTWRDAYKASLDKLEDLAVDIVLGNHPMQNDTFGKMARMTEKDNPFINAGEWKQFIQNTRRSFEMLEKNDPIL